jgi:pilus assembly protein FimV
LIVKSHRWPKTALALAVAAVLGLSSSGAFALSLGRITVLSALGEGLRAEIDVPDINTDEAATLKAQIAAPSAFASAGMEFNPALTGLQISLQRRPDGRNYIRVSGERAINDPFIDLILEASWSSGRIVRDYTLLFDPPALRQASPAPTLAQTPSAAPSPSTTTGSSRTQTTAPEPAPARIVPKAAPLPPKAAPQTQSVAPSDKQWLVKEGDTASKIANRNKPSGVSLDQMLVALLRTNPDAFSRENINRLRSGVVVDIPTQEEALATPSQEATQIVMAHSKDFNEFRRSLAASAPKADVAPSDRKTSGKVDTKIEDKKPAAAAPDKLTLSKGSVQAKADEARIAKERADKDAAARAAEIAKNIQDLSKLSAASAPASTPKTVPADKPSPAASAPVNAASDMAVTAPAMPAASAPEAAASVPQPAASAAEKPKLPASAPPAPMPEPPGLLDELLGDPMVPLAAGGLVALLGGFAFYRVRQRKKKENHDDSSFLDSKLQPESFFDASGGQHVDTANAGTGNPSSMVYSTSQLEGADDVDPVAEADVYLAYGRDAQAEEILKTAAKTNPDRLAIHTKLLEIFAKRRDTANFQTTAQHAFTLTGVDTPEWQRICELGLSIDPENPLYQPGGATASAFATLARMSEPEPGAFNATVVQATDAHLKTGGTDVDLDLDFSAEQKAAEPAEPKPAEPAPDQTTKLDAVAADSPMDLDFDISAPAELTATPELPDISLSLDEPGPAPTTKAEAPKPAPAPVEDAHMLEFDMDSLSLDLEPPAAKPVETATEAPDSGTEDPLETKLALAEEFVSIGDEDGARALIEEVISEATGAMKAKAQSALANLS